MSVGIQNSVTPWDPEGAIITEDHEVNKEVLYTHVQEISWNFSVQFYPNNKFNLIPTFMKRKLLTEN